MYHKMKVFLLQLGILKWIQVQGEWPHQGPGAGADLGLKSHVQSPSAPLHQSEALLPKIGPRPQVPMVGFSVPAELF